MLSKSSFVDLPLCGYVRLIKNISQYEGIQLCEYVNICEYVWLICCLGPDRYRREGKMGTIYPQKLPVERFHAYCMMKVAAVLTVIVVVILLTVVTEVKQCDKYFFCLGDNPIFCLYISEQINTSLGNTIMICFVLSVKSACPVFLLGWFYP